MPPRVDIPQNPDIVVFGRLVRTYRVYLGMSQEAFGRRVGLDQGSVSRLERGVLPGIRLRKLIPILKDMGLTSRRVPRGDSLPEQPK